MKNAIIVIIIAMLGGILTLGSYKVFIEEDKDQTSAVSKTSDTSNFLPVSNNNINNRSAQGINANFTEAAEKTVNGVVHVKNVAIMDQSNRFWQFESRGKNNGKALRGAGSGVIITPDGYIVTNNHVIKGAGEIEVTLNNNQTYTAEVIGEDPIADIALIKIDAEDLEYIPFGDSDNVRLGEWVLAIGNPFNLTSTVTAGIVSATARGLSFTGGTPNSFIQTDAAINPGNSGGALIDVNGKLIGINTAITSQTGSYIGYGFAVPSNNAKKIVEDIIEYGDVQQAILGIRGQDLNSEIAQKLDVNVSQGVYVGDVESGSGAAEAGIREGDIIRQIDGITVRNMSDLTGYINSKRPEDVVQVKLLRNGDQRQVNVELGEYVTFAIQPIGIEVANASEDVLEQFNAENGVQIIRALTGDVRTQSLVGLLITKIEGQKISSVSDVKKIMNIRDEDEPLSVTFRNPQGEERTFVIR